jgi:hypothetical protein
MLMTGVDLDETQELLKRQARGRIYDVTPQYLVRIERAVAQLWLAHHCAGCLRGGAWGSAPDESGFHNREREGRLMRSCIYRVAAPAINASWSRQTQVAPVCCSHEPGRYQSGNLCYRSAVEVHQSARTTLAVRRVRWPGDQLTFRYVGRRRRFLRSCEEQTRDGENAVEPLVAPPRRNRGLAAPRIPCWQHRVDRM